MTIKDVNTSCQTFEEQPIFPSPCSYKILPVFMISTSDTSHVFIRLRLLSAKHPRVMLLLNEHLVAKDMEKDPGKS